jgi:hypothetical protein
MKTPPTLRRRPPLTVTTGASPARFRGLWPGGLRCTSDRPWPEFARLAVTVALPDGQPPIEVLATVVSCEPCREEPEAFELALQLLELPASGLSRVHSELLRATAEQPAAQDAR